MKKLLRGAHALTGAVIGLGLSAALIAVPQTSAAAQVPPHEVGVVARDTNRTCPVPGPAVDTSCCRTTVSTPEWAPSGRILFNYVYITVRITCNGSARVLGDPDSFVAARVHNARTHSVVGVDDLTLRNSVTSVRLTAYARCPRVRSPEFYGSAWFTYTWRNSQIQVRENDRTIFSSNWEGQC